MRFDNLLIGKTVEKAETVHDYAQIYFTDGGILSIYNHFVVLNDKTRGLLALNGLKVTGTGNNADGFAIFFEQNVAVRVGLSNEDYSGPEAMQYSNGDQIIVWRE